MSEFVHLHNHSDYSLLDGACKISDYVAKAQKLGMRHLALTDHGNLFGALHFEKSCHKAGINPIIGSEVYVAPRNRFEKKKESPRYYHMVLFAKNETGYRNLMTLTSKGYLEGFYHKPRIDDELLEEYHDGLMASAACLGGEIPKAILNGDMIKAKKKALYYQDLFGKGNFWLEVMNHGMKEEETVRRGMRQLNEETGIPIIATNDIHFLEKSHANAHDILICISTRKVQSDNNRLKTENPEFYFKTEKEMRALFPDFPDAIENTLKLAQKCDLHIPQPGPQLPDYKIPQDFPNPDEYLRHLTNEGLKFRYPNLSQEEETIIRKRTDYELSVIAAMEYPGYFLIVWDFIDWARKHNIPVGPGRGSGPGSIVAYALRITDIDPIKYGLLFERFLNKERISMPDFDIDFCIDHRDEVFNYIREKYGKDNVARICTFGTLKTKAVIRDVGRVLGIPLSEVNTICTLLPGDKTGKLPDGKKITVKNVLKKEPRLNEYYEKGGQYKILFEVSSILEGMNRHLSTHACGNVIGRSALTNYVPLIVEQKSKEIMTAYTMDIIEDCGLVKMDLLGLKTLTILQRCETLIKKKVSTFNLEEIHEEDKTTFDMLSQGKSEAVFQFESEGMQATLQKAKPTCIEDLIALNALYRPGPMQFIDQFADSKNGKKAIQYPHPSLENILSPTYGVIVYQEQVMQVAQIIGGFSLEEADLLRRAIGKKKEKEMEQMEQKFLEGAKVQGHSKKDAKNIFDILKPFAGYGFNKSHAATYALLAYRTAYCKANYPVEFWASVLTHESGGDPDKFRKYLATVKSQKINILPPDINLSETSFSAAEKKIIYGFEGIKGVGKKVSENIVRTREETGKFTGIQDFLEKIGLKTVPLNVLEIFLKVGIFDSIEPRNRGTLLHNIDKVLTNVKAKEKERSKGQRSLFDESDEIAYPKIQWEQKEDWTDSEKLEIEKELLGLYVSGHPLNKYKNIWEKTSTINLEKTKDYPKKSTYHVLGLLTEIHEINTKKGTRMATAGLEDFNGKINLTLFSQVYEKYENLLKKDSVLGVSGILDEYKDKPILRVESIKSPEDFNVWNVHIVLKEGIHTEESILDLRDYLLKIPGSGILFLHLKENGIQKIVKASSQIEVNANDVSMANIQNHHLVMKAWKE